MESILESDFAKSLGEPTDFDGHHRIMFSLDTQRSEIANAQTLPKMVNLLEDIVGSKLDLRICKGAYKYNDGQFCNEVSFLIKVDSDELSQKIHQYVRENTRQESALVINKFNNAALFYTDTWKGIVELGQWKLVDKEVALQAFAHTRIGDHWYVASKPDEIIVDEAKAALLNHKISRSITESIGLLELSHFDSNSIQWASDMEGFDTRIRVFEGYPSGMYRLSVQTYFGFLKKTDTVSADLFERINNKLVDLLRFSLNLKIESTADNSDHWLCSICFDSTEEFFVASNANQIVIQVILTAGEAWNLLQGSTFVALAKPEGSEEAA
ncbi:MAG: hypothetical protein AAGB31_12425 [Bdellovibrio sp.]